MQFRCGYTASGYELISKLSKKDGVAVLLFPCNQFGAQEPGSNADILSFCALNGADAAITLEKGDVNGENTRPTYQYIKTATGMPTVRWNFAGKFLVDKSGTPHLIADEKNIETDIERMLSE